MDAISRSTARPPRGRPRPTNGHSRAHAGQDEGEATLAGASHPDHRHHVPAGVRRGDGLQRDLRDRAAAGQGDGQRVSDQVRALRRGRADRDARAGARRDRQSAELRGAAAGRVVRARARRARPSCGSVDQRRAPLDRPGPAAVSALGAAQARARAVRRDAAGQAPQARARSARAGATAAGGRGRSVLCWSPPSPISAPR